MIDEDEDARTYAVVVNHEEQYSIWVADRELPLGWRAVGRTGSKADCLAHIDTVWTDMRPLSLRKEMAERARNPLSPASPVEPEERRSLDELVERLGVEQEIEAGLRPARTVKNLKDAIERGYVHMKFTRTSTELGIRLEPEACDLAGADFATGKGSVKLVGQLVLNYNRVRYHGDVDLATLKGSGRLEFLREVVPGEG